ncbi:VWA domain-containing protein [Bacillus sp. V3]|jgi:Ca-activated chloride channel homolog|uniref:vWA domain-containing protein n=1 Tax=[Bacillus] enclensis TaxID=1402860 RepID=UPI000691A795|nr:VWA domain-containing protein [[Bacillus] enclensis]MBH9968606.1 VWA domain-containing protein [[Bacillus] enclensis]QTC41066.1 VWA domain-containing protein [Bacillus sp. V3]QWC23156.1 VWA domain-containing protein [Bacillus haikouensis]
MKRKIWAFILLAVLLAAAAAGCSQDEKASGSKKSDSEQAAETKKENTDKEEKKNIPQAAVYNVEEIVKEKGKYDPEKLGTDEQYKKKLLKELENAPDNLSGEEAYSLVVSLVAADIEKEAEGFEKVDPVITIDSSTPEDEIDIPDQEKVNVAILLDASGSMAAEVSGGQKMKLAKQAIQKYAQDLPEGSNIMLRVYGHKGTGSDADKEMSCKSNEVVYNLGAYDEKKFSESLEQFDPAGWTPLAGAIEAAQKDLADQQGENIKNVVYVVSDGVETCDGDPVSAAKSLNGSDIQAEVNIIGFDVDNEGQVKLKEVAEAGGGQYKSVYSESELNDYLKEEYSRLYWEWLSWGNDRYFDILGQSNDIYFDMLGYGNDIYFKSLGAKNVMSSLRYDLKEMNKFKDEEAEDKYRELINIRHETVDEYFDQEEERKNKIRKDMKEKLEKKVKELKEKNTDKYSSS